MVKICIDPGHGGSDSGAIYKGRKEKDDVLKLGKAVANLLRRHGILVDETRTTDVTITLKDRSDFEKKKEYDYFISFHRNAFKPEQAHGVETYTYINQSQKAKGLADRVQKELVAIGFKDRGVKKANFHVLRETKSPAILIEVGFIDNTKDNDLFDSKFDEIAKILAKIILEEVGGEYKEPTQSPDTQTLYRVMAGSYANRDNAVGQVEKLKKAGFDAVIMVYK